PSDVCPVSSLLFRCVVLQEMSSPNTEPLPHALRHLTQRIGACRRTSQPRAEFADQESRSIRGDLTIAMMCGCFVAYRGSTIPIHSMIIASSRQPGVVGPRNP